MSHHRPVNLDLATIHFPITAVASILHRVCAVISWVGLGFLLAGLYFALGSAEDYAWFANILKHQLWAQFIVWGLLSAFGYYCAGTIKHLLQDFGLFESFEGGKFLSWAAIITGVILSLLAGVLLWA